MTPLCGCHGEPMYQREGNLRCAVKMRAASARYRETDKGRATERRTILRQTTRRRADFIQRTEERLT